MMDHLTSAGSPSSSGHRSTENAAPSHTPTPWREWDVMRSDGEDAYPQPHVGDIRLAGSNDICVGVLFGGYPSLPECDANPAFIVKAVNAHDALVKALTEIIEANKDFRDGMPQNWDGDPLQDACDAAAKLLAAVQAPEVSDDR